MSERFTQRQFAECVGDEFSIQLHNGQSDRIRLIEATALASTEAGKGEAGKGNEPFSLVFRMDAAVALPQRIYCLQHDRLGSLDIFLVPIGPDHQGMCYEAVFN